MNSYSYSDLKLVWCRSSAKKQSDYVKVGDHIYLYYTYNDGENEWVAKHDAVVTKVNTKTFKAVCEEEETGLIAIDLERSPKCPEGVWAFSDGPVVDEQAFEVFKLLNGGAAARSPGPVWVEPESLDDTILCDHNPGVST